MPCTYVEGHNYLRGKIKPVESGALSRPFTPGNKAISLTTNLFVYSFFNFNLILNFWSAYRKDMRIQLLGAKF